MSDLNVDVSEWEKFERNLGRAKPSLWKRLKAAMTGTLIYIRELILSKMGLPHGKNPSFGINYGHLAGSFAYNMAGSGIDLRGLVMSPLLYGLPVEEGRAPGRMPPPDAIALWARRKMGLSGEELDAFAWALARHIGKHGTEGVHMVSKAYDEAERSNDIDKIFEAELVQFFEELVP